MKEQDRLFIEKFLDKSDPKIAKSNQLLLEQEPNTFTKDDLLLGISMPTIKDYIKNSPKFELDTIVNLAQSEYNEARILSWALLVRDFPNIYIVRGFIDKMAHYCGNWNVVDFAAPLTSKIILKHQGHLAVGTTGYSLFRNDELNVWSHRFCIVMALPLVQAGHLNYAIDIVERSIDSDENLIHKPCGLVLKEIKKQNENIFNLFMKDNLHRMSNITKKYANHVSK